MIHLNTKAVNVDDKNVTATNGPWKLRMALTCDSVIKMSA